MMESQRPIYFPDLLPGDINQTHGGGEGSGIGKGFWAYPEECAERAALPSLVATALCAVHKGRSIASNFVNYGEEYA